MEKFGKFVAYWLPSIVLLFLFYWYVFKPMQDEKMRRLLPIRSFFEEISDKEIQVFHLLKKVDTGYIQNVCDRPNIVTFRRMIADLKALNECCPDKVKRELGEAYQAVMAL